MVYLPLWKMMEFVSRDDFPFPTEWKVIIHSMVPVTTNQYIWIPVCILVDPFIYHVYIYIYHINLPQYTSWWFQTTTNQYPYFGTRSDHRFAPRKGPPGPPPKGRHSLPKTHKGWRFFPSKNLLTTGFQMSSLHVTVHIFPVITHVYS